MTTDERASKPLAHVLTERTMHALAQSLSTTTRPPRPRGRRPLHVLYGGAHLFKSDARVRLGGLVEKLFGEVVVDEPTLARVFDIDRARAPRVFAAVARALPGAVHDVRIDFEDGFGPRSDDEEDAFARAAARAFVEGQRAGTLPERVGIRPKALSGATATRALRTIDAFFATIVDEGGAIDAPFVVTLPKVEHSREVSALVLALEDVARALAVPIERFEIELMIETPRALRDEEGRSAVRALVDAGRGLTESVHIGAYDLLASLDVPAHASTLLHPLLDVVRAELSLALAGTGVAVVDGATTTLPTGVHKAKAGAALSPREVNENRAAIVDALRLHARHVSHALDMGITRGWDLHPGQVLARLVALADRLSRDVDAALPRLAGFLAASARAMRTGSVFDDAASARGLVNTVLAAARVGLVDDDALSPLGVSLADLATRDFAELVRAQ